MDLSGTEKLSGPSVIVLESMLAELSVKAGFCSLKSGSDGDWYWADKKGWIWTKENIYPYFFSDNTDDWIFFDSENSNAYNFQSKVWKDWDELELEVQSKEKKLEQAIGTATNTDEGIINIINSDLSESEKLDGIAKMILFGL